MHGGSAGIIKPRLTPEKLPLIPFPFRFIRHSRALVLTLIPAAILIRTVLSQAHMYFNLNA